MNLVDFASNISLRVVSICFLSTLILGLTHGACKSLFKNAALRHACWTTAFVLILLLPIVQELVPPLAPFRIEFAPQTEPSKTADSPLISEASRYQVPVPKSGRLKGM